ncbi:MAG: hypothetical protein C0620_08325 [Desulfuromonas sp.]|nr:MAG: hypothetical protein C0620_08325 [Desulfuromonas sp.]
MVESYAQLLQKGIKALKHNSPVEALMLFEQANDQHSTPLSRSYLAYCLAKVKGQHQRAISLCKSALRDEPHNSAHYLNLGRIYMNANRKEQAMQIFRRGIKLGPNPELLEELKKFDRRQPLVFPTLPRTHLLNKYSGKLLSFIGFR